MRRISSVLLFSAISGLVACSGELDSGNPNSAPGSTPGGTDPGMMGAGGTGTDPGNVANGGGAAGAEQPWMPPMDGAPFTGPIVSGPGATSRFPRLTHVQWERTVTDLLGLTQSLGLSSSFIAEPLLSMFDNNGSVLSVSTDLWLDYQRAAEAVGLMVAQDPQIIARILPNAPADVAARSRAFIEAFGLRAYRRPLNETEIARIQALFDQGTTLLGGGDPFLAGVELVVSFMLQSPHFLYRAELSSTVIDGKIPLNGYEVANRLSYGLLNSMPDQELLAAATAGTLATREALVAQATRLLATPAAQDTVRDFHAQLLRMREYDNISKDDPLFEGDPGADLKQEALTFATQTVFGPTGTFAELLTAPYTYGNSRVRDIYGADVVAAPQSTSADDWGRIDLDPTHRAGLLTQIGFLAANGEGATPNSIMRGVHISKRVLCVDLPPPPDMIPPLPALSPDQTNRQRVETLTGGAPCNTCHGALINPLGFALEKLDGFGQYRELENDHPVDASATYTLDGAAVSYDGAVEFAQVVANSQQAHNCYSRRWAEYLYGHDLDPATVGDQNLILQGGSLSKGGAQVQNLIVQLLATDALLSRLP
jgi:hypothetical protein